MDIMFSRIIAEFKWVLLALVLACVLDNIFNSDLFRNETMNNVSHKFLGLNFVLEILVYFAFSTFVVFGIKGFFEMYSQKTANMIIFVSGVILTAVIFVLSYQILFQD